MRTALSSPFATNPTVATTSGVRVSWSPRSSPVDAVTTSQSEADEKRGREIRKQEERAGREARRREREARERAEADEWEDEGSSPDR